MIPTIQYITNGLI